MISPGENPKTYTLEPKPERLFNQLRLQLGVSLAPCGVCFCNDWPVEGVLTVKKVMKGPEPSPRRYFRNSDGVPGSTTWTWNETSLITTV